jgi:hypothetical protein
MCSDNYAYDFYTWHNDIQCAQIISKKIIGISLHDGLKKAIKNGKKREKYAQEYWDSESDVTITTCDEYWQDEIVNDNNTDDDNKNTNEKKKITSWCCLFILFVKKKIL